MADTIRTIFNKPKLSSMTRLDGAANNDNMDDYNHVDSIDIIEGTIQSTPVNPKDIVNKAYADGIGGSLSYGEIYAYDETDTLTISGTGIANKVQVVSFDTNGESSGTTPDHTNNHITITSAGKYKVTIRLSGEVPGGAISAWFWWGLWKNNGATQFTNITTHYYLNGAFGTQNKTTSVSGIIDCAVNDTLELWLWNVTDTSNVIIKNVNMNVIKLA